MEGIFLVDKVSLGQGFLRGPQFSPLIDIPVKPNTNLFIDHQRIQYWQMI